MKHLRRLNLYFARYRWHVLAGIVFVMLANVMKVLSPRVLGYAIDLVTENIAFYGMLDGFDLQDALNRSFLHALLLFSGAYLLLSVISGGFTFLVRQTIIVMSRRIEFDLKNDIYTHYQALDQAFYKRNDTGDLMSRITEDVSRVRMYLGPALMYFINTLFLTTFTIGMMWSINPTLTLYVLIPLPLLSISIFYVNGLINRGSEAIQRQLSTLTSDAQESFSGIRVIKSYVQEAAVRASYDSASDDYKEKSLHLARIEAFFFPLMVLLIGASTVITIFIGGMQVIRGAITPGNIAEFVIYVNMLTWPVTSLGWIASIIQRASASQERINAFLDTEPAITSEGSDQSPVVGDIRFDGVTFTYPDTGITALRDIDLHIPAGEKWAIVGRTGSGKTSMAELLFRMYDPDDGRILVDGIDIRDRDLFHYRDQIGYVPQDVFLFSDSVRNNIRFADAELGDDAVETAARQAAILDEIHDFAQGMETRVGERGVTLSGGQKQRISIARALIKKPNVLVLDDCLSAVDAHTEERILDELGAAIEGRTTLVITHRIFTLFDLDHIVVLDEGRIAERGTHEELLAKKGAYFDIWQLQQRETEAPAGS